MRAFVSVAKLGSFTEAARRLQLSASVVTRSIAQLEDQLGLTLLLRTTRSLRLTERGELYLESCQQILQDVDSAERQVRGEDAEPRGTLKVAAPIVFGRLHVLPIVNRVLHDYRDVAVELTLSDRNAHLVEEGVDVAVRIGELADSSLIAVKLGVVSRVVVASPTYLKRAGRSEIARRACQARHHRVRRAHRHRRLAVSRRRKTGAPGAATDGQQRRCIDRSGGSGYRDHAHPVLSGPSLRHRRPSHADSATIRAATIAGECDLSGAANHVRQHRRLHENRAGLFQSPSARSGRRMAATDERLDTGARATAQSAEPAPHADCKIPQFSHPRTDRRRQ